MRQTFLARHIWTILGIVLALVGAAYVAIRMSDRRKETGGVKTGCPILEVRRQRRLITSVGIRPKCRALAVATAEAEFESG